LRFRLFSKEDWGQDCPGADGSTTATTQAAERSPPTNSREIAVFLMAFIPFFYSSFIVLRIST
jgi:hypothetical protein